jgi:hypothetical protein
MTAVGPGGAGACASRCFGTRAAAAVGGHSLPPRAARNRVPFVAPPAAEHLPQAGPRAQEIPGVRVMGPGGRDAGAFAGTAPRRSVAKEGASEVTTWLPGGLAQTCRDAGARGLIGAGLADRRPVLLARGRLDGRSACRAFAPQGPAAAAERPSGPPRGGRDRRLGAAAPATPHGDWRGSTRVVCGLAPRAGLPGEGRSEAQRQTVCSTNVSQPGPR